MYHLELTPESFKMIFTHFCSLKTFRYPPKSYGKDLESAEERREREQQDLELAKEMAEEDDDVFP